MSFQTFDIEGLTLANEKFRDLIYTSDAHTKNPLQIALMTLKPGQSIGLETHGPTQFFRIESGKGTVICNGKKKKIQDGSAFVIPSGSEHNVTADTKLKLYTIYFPPEHKIASKYLRLNGEIVNIETLHKGRTMFRKETTSKEIDIALVLRKNPHPNIVTFYTIAPKRNYIDMELLDVSTPVSKSKVGPSLKKVKDHLKSLGFDSKDWDAEYGIDKDGTVKFFGFRSLNPIL